MDNSIASSRKGLSKAVDSSSGCCVAGKTIKKHPMLTAEQQIAHMLDSGVRFRLIPEDTALQYLQKNNNYFRLRAYRHGFAKYEGGLHDGKYVDLDFAMLVDLATIDMHLRYELLPICLGVEHFSKVKLLKRIELEQEDGYELVQDFLSTRQKLGSDGSRYNPVLNEINRGKNGPYTNGLIEHYEKGGYPIWAFVELIPFGRFNELWMFCAERFNSKQMKKDFYMLQATKGTRNACGHNSCIINELEAGTPRYDACFDVRRAVGYAHIRPTSANSKLSNDRIVQLTTALYLHKTVASSGVLEYRSRVLREFVCRMYRNEGYYEKNQQISSFFSYMRTLVGAWYPSETC